MSLYKSLIPTDTSCQIYGPLRLTSSHFLHKKNYKRIACFHFSLSNLYSLQKLKFCRPCFFNSLNSGKDREAAGAAMASFKILTLIALVLCSCQLFCSAQADSNQTAYTVLKQYGFPPGVLPTNVKNYTLNEDGSFEICFEGSCSFSLESGYSLKYRDRITGRISMGSLKDLQGIKVKVLIFWLTIDGVVREGDNLEFSVGIASASFPVDNFIESPQCGCGFDCNALLRAQA